MKRKTWYWGVSGHNKGYPVYPEKQLEKQISLCVELGLNMYRINYTPQKDDEFPYLDKVVNLCNENNLDVFLVIYDTRLTNVDDERAKGLFEGAKKIAARYGDRIALYQVSNEQDIAALDLEKYKDPVGDEEIHYSKEKYENIKKGLCAISDGLKAGFPGVRTCINMSWRHTYLLNMLVRDNVHFDVAGLDWYYDLSDSGSNNLARTLNILDALPAEQIIIAEANSWEGDYKFTEEQQAEYNVKAMDYYYNFPSEKIIGHVFYELLDEADKERGEGFFGLVKCDISGIPGRVKKTYTAIQNKIREQG